MQANPVSLGDVVLRVEGLAKVVPARTQVIAASADGVVLTVPINDGSIVAPGDMLAELDNPVIRKQRDDAKVQQAVARAELATERASIAEFVYEREDALFRAQSAEATAKSRFNAESALHERGIVGGIQLAERRADMELATQSVRFAERRLDRANESAKARAAAAEARAQLVDDTLAAIENEVVALAIHAPMEGVVTALSIKPGQAVTRGMAIAEIHSQEYRIEITVPESAASELARDQLVDLRSPNGAVAARISQVGATQVQGMIKILADLQGEPPGWMRSGQTLDASVEIATIADAIHVKPPLGAAPHSTSLAYVIASGTDTAKRVRIKWGRVSGSAAIIIEGAAPGDEVLAYTPDGQEGQESFHVAR